jgi:ATP-dependent protease ClpP protease subunit
MQTTTVFGTFCDDITPETLSRLYNNFAGATQRGCTEIHLLFQTGGGSISDGISLFSYLRGFPVNIHLYNTGGVDSAGLIAFVGVPVERRYATPHAAFLLHKGKRALLTPEGAEGHLALSKMMTFENAHCETILRAETTIPADKWSEYTDGADVFITAQDALQYGLIGQIREFQPQTGQPLFDF